MPGCHCSCCRCRRCCYLSHTGRRLGAWTARSCFQRRPQLRAVHPRPTAASALRKAGLLGRTLVPGVPEGVGHCPPGQNRTVMASLRDKRAVMCIAAKSICSSPVAAWKGRSACQRVRDGRASPIPEDA